MSGEMDKNKLEVSQMLDIPNGVDENIVWKSVDVIVNALSFGPLAQMTISTKFPEYDWQIRPISLKNFHLIRVNPEFSDNDVKVAFRFYTNAIEGGLLNLLKIPDLSQVSVRIEQNSSDDIISLRLGKAFIIINSHLSNEKRNILLCQEELIDNDLKDYAEF
jgi:hypothetical protein